MAMVEPEDRFHGAEDPEDRRRRAEERCLDAEQRCFRAERRRFEAERQREQVQRLLAEARQAGLRMGEIVEELRRLVARMHEAAERQSAGVEALAATGAPGSEETPAPASPQGSLALVSQPPAGQEDDGDRMVEALTAAIARLRANVEAVGEAPVPPPGAVTAGHSTRAQDDAAGEDRAAGRRAPHKHSLSWVARWRNRRKQRKSR